MAVRELLGQASMEATGCLHLYLEQLPITAAAGLAGLTSELQALRAWAGAAQAVHLVTPQAPLALQILAAAVARATTQAQVESVAQAAAALLSSPTQALKEPQAAQ